MSSKQLNVLAAATGAVLGVIAISKAYFVGAVVFYGFAILYLVAAATVTPGPRRAALTAMMLADTIWLVAEGQVLMNGVPTEPLADLFVVAVGVPIALANLALAAFAWVRRVSVSDESIDETQEIPV